MKKNLKYLLILLIYNQCNTIDNPHFYRASHFFGEPRLKKNCLTSIDFWGAAGRTPKGYNCFGEKTNVLNIFGDENIKFLTKGVAKDILNRLPGNIINNLWESKTGTDFGKLKFAGVFSTFEIVIDYYKNFYNGFFTQLYIPFRKLKFSDIRIKDLTKRNDILSYDSFIRYKQFVRNIESNLHNFDICLQDNFQHTGIGDTSILFGWTKNCEDTRYIDFLDFTIKLGILIPTGRKQNINILFDLPQGYNGHFAIPVYFDLSVGLYDWLTLGIYSGALFFGNRNKCIRMKTAVEQNGFIKLSKGLANVNKGTIWSFGLFAKADHLFNGFSFIFGYRFDKENKTRLCPFNAKIFNSKIVNSDQMLKGWQMETMNFFAEYDFATLDHPNLPRISVFFDVPIHGKQIFKTQMSGIGIGIDFIL